MRRLMLILPLVLTISIVNCPLSIISASNRSHTSMSGTDTVPAEFFREWYHRSDLIFYLEAQNDHTIVETHTTGQWWLPERLTFAIDGLPCTANRYYIDGFRVDDRFQPGSSLFVPNMQRYDLNIDIHNASLSFARDTLAGDYVTASYNFGQVGNGAPAAGTQAIINLFHRSAVQSADLYKHITDRRHLAGAGTVDAAYTFHDKTGNAFRQHLYAALGQRLITKEDQCGLILDDPLYGAYYYKVQADGLLPIKPNKVFDRVGYMLNFSGREDGGSEYLYNFNEVYNHRNYSASLYAKRQYLTTGLTWSTNTVRHDNQQFDKNLIDQDGESFLPWIADGNTHFLTWSVNYEQPVLPWLKVHVDASNSMVYFSPTNTQFSNTVYLQTPVKDAPRQDLYRYDWTSHAFAGGLLENTIGLKAHYPLCKQLDINGFLDFTLDGFLLRNKSKVSPNVQAAVNFDLHPCKWFEMGLTVGHYRVAYNADHLRYFSDDYMNADIYHAGTNTLFATTGGQYHHYKKGLHQTGYLEVNIPIRFVFGKGRHEIVLQNSYKKFYNVWHTYFAGAATDYGYFQQLPSDNPEQTTDVFFQNDGVKQYEVGYTEPFGSNGLLNTPYFFSQLTRYTYTGRKVTVSIGWQSMQAAGYTGLGNGANSNTLGVLSETTANPNTTNVLHNPSGKYKGVSRMDLDKAFVARFYLGYNICPWVQAGLTFKWTDGKPFTSYYYYLSSNSANGPTSNSEAVQAAILPLNSRGTNPTDGNFGTRHGAVFHCNLHLQGRWTVQRPTTNDKRPISMCLNIECYNIWDFSHDLAEMAFTQDIPGISRSSMILTVPTGILATYTIEL